MNELYSPAVKIGELLANELQNNPHFYFFSPDETTSNKFDKVYDVERRAWGLDREPWDLPSAPDGHIIELLSENVLFSTMTGHLMNGEPAMMGSYEAFYSVITSQILQQIKFIKQSLATDWRPDCPAVNLLSTSTCWRQDHNGFTHQSPALISALLANPSRLANCFFPADDIMAEATFNFMLQSTNVVNFTTFNKIPEPRYFANLPAEPTKTTILPDFSDENPDIIFAAIGDIQTKEAAAAIQILKNDLPELKLRLVNISALSYRAIGTINHPLSTTDFNSVFTIDRPIIINFHGYPEAALTIFENYTDRKRLRVHGFNEEGSTTTPFEMLSKNASSRYDLAIDVAKILNRPDLISKYRQAILDNHEYAIIHGTDLPSLT